MAFSVPPLKTLSADVAATLSPEAVERHIRLACIVHMMHDMAEALAQDLADPANQTEEALSMQEYMGLSQNIILGLSKLSRLTYSGDLDEIVAICRGEAAHATVADTIPPEAC